MTRIVKSLQELAQFVCPEEFFSSGACWAYAFALGRRLNSGCWCTTDIPKHAWVEEDMKCYDINCDGVSRENLLKTLLANACEAENAERESKRLAATALGISANELRDKYRVKQMVGASEFEISWELAVNFADKVIEARRGFADVTPPRRAR